MILQAGVTGGAMAGTTLADGGHRWRPDTPVGDGGDSGDGGDGGDDGGQPGLQPRAGCHGARARNALLAPGHQGNVIYQYSPLLETCACDTLLS